MGLKGQMGASGNIERPRTAKHKKDAEARKNAERKQYPLNISRNTDVQNVKEKPKSL